jgi:hypothetical protein
MKNPVGRPTNYTPDLCEKVIPLLAEGASMEEIGLELGVGYTVLYEYMDKHPEFANAIKKGRELSKGWWLKEGRVSLRDKDFSPTLWYMNMKNRFGWTDKQENHITAIVKQEDALKELE